MKKIIISIFILISIMVLSAPICTALSTSVTARCNREFTFVCPTKLKMAYGSTSNTTSISMEDFFCYENEVLLLSLKVENLVHENGKHQLPVGVSCGRLHTGFDCEDASRVTLNIPKRDWKNAPPGNYEGKLIWVITSSLSGEVLGEYMTHISTTVPDVTVSSENPKMGQPLPNLMPLGVSLVVLLLLKVYRYRSGYRIQPK